MVLFYSFLLALSVESLASAAVIPSSASKPGVLQIDFDVTRSANVTVEGAVEKRGLGSIAVNLQNDILRYTTTLQLGTPPQSFEALIDTGSSDLWVFAKENDFCSKTKCYTTGSFDHTASSTYKSNNSKFGISYGTPSYEKGNWSTDTLSFGGIGLSDFSFGLGLDGNTTTSILGIGYSSGESSIKSTGVQYRNLPERLLDSGITHSNAYSLWLNDLKESTGSILFGGVDHAKYEGTLTKLPVLPDPAGKISRLNVPLSGVTVSTNGVSKELLQGQGIAALLDTGSSLTAFPKSIIEDVLVNQFQGALVQPGIYATFCDIDGTLEFDFLGTTISIPFADTYITATNPDGSPISYFGRDICIIGIAASNFNFAILGDTFLRSAYVVYDLANNEIAIAKAKTGATGSNIEAIESTIPSATNAPQYSATAGIEPIEF